MRVLMCMPTEYKVTWEINPWMSLEDQPDAFLAWQQWHNLFLQYQRLPLRILLVPQAKGLYDMIFSANAGWGRKGKFVLANFRHPERRREQPYWKNWLESFGIKTLTLPKDIYFEGQGDWITTKEVYLFGWGQRSSFEAHRWIANAMRLKKEVVPLRLIDPKFYHLDTCLMYIAPLDTIMYYPQAFDEQSRDAIQRLSAEKIEVTREEAESFICNGVYFGDTVILGGTTKRIANKLRRQGLEVITVDVSQFKKSGAGVRCLTLFLD